MADDSEVTLLARKYFPSTFPGILIEACKFFNGLLEKISIETLKKISEETAVEIARYYLPLSSEIGAQNINVWIKKVEEILSRHNLSDIDAGKLFAAMLIIVKFSGKMKEGNIDKSSAMF